MRKLPHARGGIPSRWGFAEPHTRGSPTMADFNPCSPIDRIAPKRQRYFCFEFWSILFGVREYRAAARGHVKRTTLLPTKVYTTAKGLSPEFNRVDGINFHHRRLRSEPKGVLLDVGTHILSSSAVYNPGIIAWTLWTKQGRHYRGCAR